MVTGCPGTDGPTTGTGAVPDLGDNTGTDDGGDAPDVVEVEDKYVPPPPPPGECALFIDKPTSNQDTFGSVEIVGSRELELNDSEAAAFEITDTFDLYAWLLEKPERFDVLISTDRQAQPSFFYPFDRDE